MPPRSDTHTTPPSVLISEVGPRDGLQSVRDTMPTAHKIAWIEAVHQAGLREIEVGSLVPARVLPQMADVDAIVRHARTLPGLTVMALVPNRQGAEAALAAGAHKLTIPVSASEAHSLANVRRSRADMVAQVRSIVALKNERAPQVQIEVGSLTVVTGPEAEDLPGIDPLAPGPTVAEVR